METESRLKNYREWEHECNIAKFLWLWPGIGGQFWYDCGSYNWVQGFDTFDRSVGSLNRQLVCFRQIGIFLFLQFGETVQPGSSKVVVHPWSTLANGYSSIIFIAL